MGLINDGPSLGKVRMGIRSGISNNPLDTGRKLNVHKTFRRRPGRLLNVLCAFNLHPVPREKENDKK